VLPLVGPAVAVAEAMVADALGGGAVATGGSVTAIGTTGCASVEGTEAGETATGVIRAERVTNHPTARRKTAPAAIEPITTGPRPGARTELLPHVECVMDGGSLAFGGSTSPGKEPAASGPRPSGGSFAGATPLTPASSLSGSATVGALWRGERRALDGGPTITAGNPALFGPPRMTPVMRSIEIWARGGAKGASASARSATF
jgi:hypothetical protein